MTALRRAYGPAGPQRPVPHLHLRQVRSDVGSNGIWVAILTGARRTRGQAAQHAAREVKQLTNRLPHSQARTCARAMVRPYASRVLECRCVTHLLRTIERGARFHASSQNLRAQDSSPGSYTAFDVTTGPVCGGSRHNLLVCCWRLAGGCWFCQKRGRAVAGGLSFSYATPAGELIASGVVLSCCYAPNVRFRTKITRR